MKIYALCDASSLQKRGKSLADFVALSLKYNVDMIQYRNKDDDPKTVKSELLQLRKLWHKYLIINDYVEFVPFCDGVHLGQEDLLRFGATTSTAVEAVRALVGEDKLLGISTHNEKEILEANGLDLNYIGLGAYRPTLTKEVEHILGESLDELAALSKFPVGAIGGVKLSDTFKYVSYLVIGSDLYED